MPKALAQIPPQMNVFTITPYSMLESIGSKLMACNVAQSADSGRTSTAWNTANTAILVPFWLAQRSTLWALFWTNGTVVSGNVDCGIYNADGKKIVSTGSTVQAGTSTAQVVTLGTPVDIGPGLYYLALCLDNTTGTIGGATSSNLAFTQTYGMSNVATAFPLPSSLTLGGVTIDFIPLFGAFLTPNF